MLGLGLDSSLLASLTSLTILSAFDRTFIYTAYRMSYRACEWQYKVSAIPAPRPKCQDLHVQYLLTHVHVVRNYTHHTRIIRAHLYTLLCDRKH